ncbi:uncharacterized protein PHACADRAFT_210366 [Phanerochaete carnosa HHB-10118-sp]|uniref:Matrin-type domain-containing protein n=1 Tax=Phanerochaete carnosa (strain HHB-10118-sp) TaxID=650164 RepID=K5WVT2_PHACS|nr:uncharacterized protein PHACADRAFT_210366 [Phanerochaete carnosa HHB-10118-sp]EKM54567.1 hypothetical protein PHACADRAFT_210366 [Phanerochaete carnosa HHB-10118-sp]
MSEYWVSHKKYFCKYCDIYIADDKPSRTQHETGLRHKGNVERFVRGLYKAGEKRKQDSEEERREMARIERAAAASYAQDVSSGLVKPGSSSVASAKQTQAGPSKPSARPSDPYANYTTAASLGYADPDEERRRAEAERRRNQGVVGAWEVIAVEEPVSAGEAEEAGEEQEEAGGREDGGEGGTPPVPAQPSLKREAEAPPDDDDARQFKFRRKKLDTGFGEIYDPGLIPVKLKAKKEELAESTLKMEESLAPVRLAPSVSNPNATAMPKWSARGWSKPGEAKEAKEAKQYEVLLAAEPPILPNAAESAAVNENTTASDAQETTQVTDDPPAENKEPEVKGEEAFEVKKESETITSMAPPSLFKKRKAPLASAGSRGRGL